MSEHAINQATDHTANYELRVSREPSADFLAEAEGSILQAQVESVARELASEHGLTVACHARGGEPTVVVSASDPEPLWVVADTVMLRYGHELPDIQEVAPGANQLPLFATQNVYSAQSVYGTTGELIIESTARALLNEALDRDSADEDRVAATFRAEALAYRRFAERLGVDPPAATSTELQAARTLLDAIPQGAFLGLPIARTGGLSVLALLEERGFITTDERQRATVALV